MDMYFLNRWLCGSFHYKRLINLYVFSQFKSDANLKFFPRPVSLELKLGYFLAHLFFRW